MLIKIVNIRNLILIIIMNVVIYKIFFSNLKIIKLYWSLYLHSLIIFNISIFYRIIYNKNQNITKTIFNFLKKIFFWKIINYGYNSYVVTRYSKASLISPVRGGLGGITVSGSAFYKNNRSKIVLY